MTLARPDDPLVGTVIEVDIESVAHGGHCVARHEGRVVFVRHTLPGERVKALVTGGRAGESHLRADAVEVLSAAAGRREPPCRYAGPGGCGGCDFQHVDPAVQRELKAAVVAEQLHRLAGLDVAVEVEALPGDDHEDGMRWRTRVEFAVDARGRAGLRQHRSRAVVPLEDCLIAAPGVIDSGVLGRGHSPAVVALDVVAPGVGEPVVVPLGRPGGRGRSSRGRTGSGRRSRRAPRSVPLGPVPQVAEVVGENTFTLSARGFWQVHPAAASTFTAQVLEWLDPRPGERALDLYSGVGLFAVPLAQRVGAEGAVLAVEADRTAGATAPEHLRDYPWAEVSAVSTEQALADLQGGWDLVVLDPPRSGAGGEVMREIAALQPRAVVYVACDPAALARDLATAAQAGLRLRELRAFDAFPMTHHVECLALFTPASEHLVRGEPSRETG